ncbi:type II toxin-antitoxin system PrlF family antitoxin [Pseudomonas sp. BW13M1]|uniref:Type II toxin-antitoxin system PrlF family antitoxin n=1 Tax=Pseudomonas peradeniyensis TaxID=2745488 RepID=A0A923GBM4_9PSED|nr:type II toxin-antitoxin system PrlF family antitoxin [Pseudomonas peradeniyensis]MBV4507033.1 type II toxin-antitoxin system PrlF family antitoxin [Pseudomonas peradeniyensis]
MATTFEAESTLTERYQTTVPETVRRALGLKKRDKIHYSIRPDGAVILTRAETAEEDPAVGQFLDFLARDIATNPQRLKVVDAEFVARLDALVGDVEIDLDQPLSADDE